MRCLLGAEEVASQVRGVDREVLATRGAVTND